MQRKPVLAKFLISTLVASVFILVNTLSFGTATASTTVTGIINSDTTWTKANSPYDLTGNVLVNTGVTLTIERGVTVNLNGYYIMVNGTLRVRGDSTEQALINYGQIIFNSFSSGWQESTGTGCIIENAVLDNVPISSSVTTLKISGSSINGSISVGGSSIVTNSIINGSIEFAASSGSVVSNNDINGEVSVRGGSTVISGNNIKGGSGDYGIHIEPSVDAQIFGNTISKCFCGIKTVGDATIERNSISNSYYGIIIGESVTIAVPWFIYGHNVIRNNTIYNSTEGILSIGNNTIIADNVIAECKRGFSTTTYSGTGATLERNSIINNNIGIEILGTTAQYMSNTNSIIVLNNTISDNVNGLKLSTSPPAPTISYNNFRNNSEYNLRLADTTSSVDATYNWWGTTNTHEINQTIYDFKYDFNLGTVNFVPFLTEPNLVAMPNPNAPIPTPIPTASPSPSSTQTPSASSSSTPSPSQNPTATPASPQTGLSGTEIALIIALIVITSILAITLTLLLKKKR